jgi:hypothetical protein
MTGHPGPTEVHERPVPLVRGGEAREGLLRWARRPVEQDYRIELDSPVGRLEGIGRDLFDALVRLREQLAGSGWQIAVQGSRKDTFPTGMVRDMIAARRVYVLAHGRQARREDLVDIFAPADPATIASPDEQEHNYRAWRASTG